MTPSERLKEIEKNTKGYVCLVPKQGAEHTITCHEYSDKLCDCEVLYLIARVRRLEAALEEISKEICFPITRAAKLKEIAIKALEQE